MGLHEELSSISAQDVDGLDAFLKQEADKLMAMLVEGKRDIGVIAKGLTPPPIEPSGLRCLRDFISTREKELASDEVNSPDDLILMSIRQEGYEKGVIDLTHYLLTIAQLREQD